MFQFHTGTIDSIKKEYEDINKFRFNSTLVRLIAVHPQQCAVLCKFQFHTGTIDRRFVIAADLTASKFQFHTGTIDRSMYNERKVQIMKFQFHTGTIDS